MKQRISACMVVYNEEKVIERCLKSIAPVTDEIIVVHDGECTDQTQAIAQKYGAKFYSQPHHGSSESHRVFSYEQATCEWVLQIDADEFLSDKLARELRALVEVDDIDAYAFAWPAFNGRSYYPGPFSMSPRPCLFRKSRMYFVAITHSAPRTYGQLVNRLDLILEHRPRYNNNTFAKMRTKYFAWSRLEAKQVLQLASAEKFQVPDLTQTDEYKYFTKVIHHPLLRGGAQIVRVWLRAGRYYLRHPKHVLIWDNIKSQLILSINLTYFAWQVMKLKPQYRREVATLFAMSDHLANGK